MSLAPAPAGASFFAGKRRPDYELALPAMGTRGGLSSDPEARARQLAGLEAGRARKRELQQESKAGKAGDHRQAQPASPAKPKPAQPAKSKPAGSRRRTVRASYESGGNHRGNSKKKEHVERTPKVEPETQQRRSWKDRALDAVAAVTGAGD